MKQHSGRGFTLIEVLVALAVLGLISSLLVVAFGQARDVLRVVMTNRDRQGDVIEFQRTLRTWLGYTQPFPDDRTAGQTIAAFHGTGAELTFSAPIAPVEGQNDLYRIHINVQGDDVVAFIAPDRAGLDIPPQIQVFPLLSDIQDLQLSYFDAATGAWQNQWQARPDVPAAVKVSVAFPPGDDRQWDELTVYLQITGEQVCEFDPVVRRCR